LAALQPGGGKAKIPGAPNRIARRGQSMKRFFRPAGVRWSAAGQAHGLAHGAVFKRLLISGQPGVDEEGTAPTDLEAQFSLAFDNVFKVLEAGQMARDDLVRIVVYVAAPDAYDVFQRVREQKLGALTPVASYVEAAGFCNPNWQVLIEGEAIRDA
jgi:enamine deaminase RidA (YjgF/YER057c/UK114 family)